jgi:DNA-binding transcriptional ArsR family regulator
MQISEEKAKAQESNSEALPAVQMSGTGQRRLTLADIELLLRLHKDGRTQTEIATMLGVTQSAVSQQLARLNETPAVVQALMKGESVGVLAQWRRATRIAAKRGDHRPAREWIEAAHPELRPQQGNSAGGGGVTINIGMPGAPLALPTIEITPSRAALSPSVSDDLHSLTPSKTES